MLKWIGSILILIDISNSTSAQNLLYGKIYLINSHEIIPEVNLRNLSNGKYAKSDQGGNFKIAASAGDVIIFLLQAIYPIP